MGHVRTCLRKITGGNAKRRIVAEARPDAIAVFCTNFRGAAIAERLEAALGIPIYDTVSTAVWAGMRLAGADPARIRGWGRLFREVA